MANENKPKMDANTCRLIGIVFAGVVAAGATWLLMEVGFPTWLAIVGFVIVWAILGIAIDGKCAGMEAAAPTAQPAAFDDTAAAERAAAEQAAEAAESERAAAEQAAAEAAEAERAAAEQAAAEAAEAERAAAEQAAAEAAEAERAAAEQAAAEAAEAERTATEQAAAERAEAERAAAEQAAAAATESVAEEAGARPETLDGPRGGVADDLKKIKGIGPKLEKTVNSLGFWHFDQVAAWTAEEVAWVDATLEGINKGRATRDGWVSQAVELAAAKGN